MIRKFKFDEDIETIRLNHLSSGRLYTDTKIPWHLLDKAQDWRRPGEIVNHPLFIDRIPHRYDALQGVEGGLKKSLSDCWLVSAMHTITMNDNLISYVVPPDQYFDDNYVGAFHFRIWKLGIWYDVVVDDLLPVWKRNGRLCYVHSMKGNVFWAALLEKACAKFFSDRPSTYNYLSIISPGSPMLALQCFSGGIIEKVQTSNLPPGLTLKWFMIKVYSNYGLMVCCCYDYIDKTKGLYSQHSYAVTKLVKFLELDPKYHGLFLVRLMNPWGTKEWKGAWSDDYQQWNRIDKEMREKMALVSRDDGEFWMGLVDFTRYFRDIWISYLDPEQYLNSHEINHGSISSTLKFSGEWKIGINAGGNSLLHRHENPQYGIQVERREGQTRSSVLIELNHFSKRGWSVLIEIGFYVYSLKNYKIPLDFEFFQKNRPLNEFPGNSETEGRAYSLSMDLAPGAYCIVPCTERENQESQFFLRVFSEYLITILWMDSKIGKTLPVEEQILNERDEVVKRLFNDVAQGQDEIDWTGVKEILETEMNPKKSYFGMISSFIHEVFEIFIPFWLSNDYPNGTDAVVFSKDECRSMIAMLDDNHSGKLSFSEFRNLWSKICFWTEVYKQHSDKTKGYITVAGLRDALSSIGYSVTKPTVISLSYVYANEQGIIYLTDFILCGITLETVLSLYEKENVQDQNKITFTLEQWVKNTLIL